MAAKRSTVWTISSSDGNHVIGAAFEPGAWKAQLKISVDGQVVSEKKSGSLNRFWGDYPVMVGPHAGTVRVRARGLGGMGFTLVLDGKEIPPGQHVTLAPFAPAQPPPAAPVAAPTPDRGDGHGVPMIPALPAYCHACGAGLSMNSVDWSGPMSATCARCGMAVEIGWKRLE